MPPLDLANVEFRTVSSASDRMEIFILDKIRGSQMRNKRKIGELVKRGGKETGSFKKGARWFLDEVHLRSDPDSDAEASLGWGDIVRLFAVRIRHLPLLIMCRIKGAEVQIMSVMMRMLRRQMPKNDLRYLLPPAPSSFGGKGALFPV